MHTDDPGPNTANQSKTLDIFGSSVIIYERRKNSPVLIFG